MQAMRYATSVLASFRRLASSVSSVRVLSAVLTALAIFAVPSARAEVGAADPIDAAMRTCLARADMSSSTGQIQCMDTARLAWRSAMDVAYAQILDKSNPEDRKRWTASQHEWLAWREVEGKLQQAVFETTSGSSYQLSAADMQLQPVRDRALALRTAAAQAGKPPTTPRAHLCTRDAKCEHATFDLNRYYRVLERKLPVRSRSTLIRAERAWLTYRDTTTPLIDESGLLDILGARVATLKRLSETVGNH